MTVVKNKQRRYNTSCVMMNMTMRKTNTGTTSMPRTTMIILFFVVAIIAMVDSFMLNSPRNSCSYTLYSSCSSSSSSYCSTTTTTSSSSRQILKSSSSRINRRTRRSSSLILRMASSSSSSSSLSSSSGGNGNDNKNNENENMMEVLNEIPFLPKEVLSKFVASIGGPLAAANIQAGYQAGIISLEELQEIQTKLPEMDMVSNNNNNDDSNDSDNDGNGIQSIDDITKKWEEAFIGQPWYIKKLGAVSSKTIVQLVAKLQQQTFEQVNAMTYINDSALILIQNNVEVVQLLSLSSESELELESESNDAINDTNDVIKLKFNNTRAKYESDRKVWSASMDVFDERRTITATATTDNTNSNNNDDKNDAVAALLLAEGIDDNENEKVTGNIGITTVVDIDVDVDNNNNEKKKKQSNSNNKIGLVNAYFIPNEEIKILVVEINDIMYNITWKGLE